MLPPPGATPPPILKPFIYLENRETERGKDENRNNLYCRFISTRGGDSRGQEEGTNVEATKTSGRGTPVHYTIPLGIVIFLVYFRFKHFLVL